jgi:AraC-like DNA-binding protein
MPGLRDDSPQASLEAVLSLPHENVEDFSPKLRGMDSNPHGAFGPRFWQAFRQTVAHLYDNVSLPDPAEEARFTLSTRTYPTPHAMLMRCQGTAFTMTRGPAQIVRGGADQLMILLQLEGTVETDYAGRRAKREPGDIDIVDYARPFHSAATDYANLMIVLVRESVPAALLAVEPHGLLFSRGSGAARLIGAALEEFYAQADSLTMSEAEAAVEGIVALTTACALARLAGKKAGRVRSRRKAALDYIDANLGNAHLGPDEVADAANMSRASLYRLLAAEGGIRIVLMKRRLDKALRLMLADNENERSLMHVAKDCGFAGVSQFSRAFHARFGAPPRQYLALVRQQDLAWHESRLMTDGFEPDILLWRQLGLRESPASGTWHAAISAAKDPDGK